MGVGVSNWKLARSVSQLGQLGVVSGALLAVVFARRLQDGDPEGHMRRALAHLPCQEVAERVLEEYYIPGGKAPEVAYASCPMPTLNPPRSFWDLTVAANFAEVYLAKEGHSGPVGLNLLEKIQMSSLASLYGAMLAKVDYVIMGAGIPRAIPGVLDAFSAGKGAELKVDVEGALPGEDSIMRFEPSQLGSTTPSELSRPKFLPIVSSSTLALSLAKKSTGSIEGFVIEADVAGGHNAPPRGTLQLSPEGEPVYGPRDVPDLGVFRKLGFPFWLAGARATPEGLANAQAEGAAGIQVGTAFAFCAESGIRPDIRQQVIDLARRGLARVFTDPLASPTGFPFKVLQLENTLSTLKEYLSRKRVCDLGYLRSAFRRDDGSLGYRCAAEPVQDFVRKGGDEAATAGRKCLCNGLAANIGLGQKRKENVVEGDLITAGNDVSGLARFLPQGMSDYTAADVIQYLTRWLKKS